MESTIGRLSSLFHSKMTRLAIVVMVSICFALVLTGATVSKYSVIIDDDEVQTIVFTSANDPMEILKGEKITLSPYDKVSFSGFEDNRGTIDIRRARMVQIKADNTTRIAHVTGGTVGDALEARGVVVDEDDFIDVSLAEPVKEDMVITINRVEYRTVTLDEEIPYKTTEFATNTLKDGDTRILSNGKMGMLTTTYDEKLIDGKVVESEVVDTVRVEPTAAKMLVGDSDAPASQLIPAEPIELDANGNPVNYIKKVTGKATAYSALGRPTKLKPGCVAMNLSQFPRGTQLYIKTPNGGYVYGYSEVRDTGTALVEGKILVDLFFNSYRESCLFGAKIVDIYVLG